MSTRYNGPILMEGYLQKKKRVPRGAITTSWRYLLFSLSEKEKTFVMKSDKEDHEPLKIYSAKLLKGFQDNLRNEDNILENDLGFVIKTTLKSYVFFAAKKEEYNKWIRLLSYHFNQTDLNNPFVNSSPLFKNTVKNFKVTLPEERQVIITNSESKEDENKKEISRSDIKSNVSERLIKNSQKIVKFLLPNEVLENKTNQIVIEDSQIINKVLNNSNHSIEKNSNLINENTQFKLEDKKSAYNQRLKQFYNIIPKNIEENINNNNEIENTFNNGNNIIFNQSFNNANNAPMYFQHEENNFNHFMQEPSLAINNLNLTVVVPNSSFEGNDIKSQKSIKVRKPKTRGLENHTAELVQDKAVLTKKEQEKRIDNNKLAISNIKLSNKQGALMNRNALLSSLNDSQVNDNLNYNKTNQNKLKVRFAQPKPQINPYNDIESFSSKLLDTYESLQEMNEHTKNKFESEQEKFFFKHYVPQNFNKQQFETIGDIENEKEFIPDGDSNHIINDSNFNDTSFAHEEILKNGQERQSFKDKIMKELQNDDWDIPEGNLTTSINKIDQTKFNSPNKNKIEQKIIKINFNEGIYDEPTMHIKQASGNKLIVENVVNLNPKGNVPKSKKNEANINENNNYGISSKQALMESINKTQTTNNTISQLRQPRDRSPVPKSKSNVEVKKNSPNKNSNNFNKNNIPLQENQIKIIKEANITDKREIEQNGKKFNVNRQIFENNKNENWEFVFNVSNKFQLGNEPKQIKKPIIKEKDIVDTIIIHNQPNLINIVKNNNTIQVPEEKFQINKDKYHLHVENTFQLGDKTVSADPHHFHYDNIKDTQGRVFQTYDKNYDAANNTVIEKNIYSQRQVNNSSNDNSILFKTYMNDTEKSHLEEDYNHSINNLSSILMGKYSMINFNEGFDDDFN